MKQRGSSMINFNFLKKQFLVITSLYFILMNAAYAGLYVEITGGQAQGLPIAIVPFAVSNQNNAEIEDIAKIIRSDLENSGQFKPTPFQKISQHPSHASEVQLSYWKNLGVDNMVIGRVEKTGSRYTIVFELLDVLKQNAETQGNKPILSMKFDNIAAQDLRKLAHHISDQIFERLIGVKGIFSTRIAYISVTDNGKNRIHTLEIADSDGFNPRALQRSSFPMMSPAWSPNGRQIAFVSFDKDRASINVIDVATGRIERITQFPGINGAPSWSPDGKTLAVVLSKDGGPKIYTIDVASKRLTKLTDGTGIDTEPSFAPDGQSIVFTSNRGGKPQIYRVSLSSGRTERLTFKGDYNAKPSLTPDGKRLVMLHKGEDGLFSIAVQTLNNSELRVLTSTSLNDSPSIAPNGMMVTYGSKDNGRGVLGAVTLDGRVKIRIPSRDGSVQEPAWSPLT